MYSPKRLKLANMASGLNKKWDIDDDSPEDYPPKALAKEGISPYFIGKNRRKKNAEKLANHALNPPVFDLKNSTEDEKIVIEEDEINEYIPESSSSSQKSILPFLNNRKSDENLKQNDEITLTSAKRNVIARSLIPKSFNRKTSQEMEIATNLKKCKNFDFSSDPNVNRIRDSICDIVDPTGEKRSKNPEFLQRIEEKAIKNIDAASEPHKKTRKKGLILTNAPFPSFTTASGQDVHRSKFLNPIVEGERSVPLIPSLHSKKSAPPEISKKPSFTAQSILKKAMMGMETNGGGKDEQVVGLRAEPSLKNFEEHIITLIESEIMSINTSTGWADVAGLEEAKKALREIVVLPFKRPDVFTGIRAPPKGVLLFGPPGTGKTLIGRCVASQCQATFFNISASSLTSKWVGEGEKLVRALFAVARVKLPSVIFIDEVDSLLSARSETEHESSRRIKTEFLVQLDGVNTAPDERLLVLGATNRPQELDEAARRRFQKRLYIALPEVESRSLIVLKMLKDTKNEINESCLENIAEITKGYSGADMAQLCREAAMVPIRDVGEQIETIDKDDIRAVCLNDFLEAVKVVRPTVDESQLDAYSLWDKKYGCLPAK